MKTDKVEYKNGQFQTLDGIVFENQGEIEKRLFAKGILAVREGEVYSIPEYNQTNEAARFTEQYFKSLRFNHSYHLGLGDIRLTVAMQEEIVDYLKNTHR